MKVIELWPIVAMSMVTSPLLAQQVTPVVQLSTTVETKDLFSEPLGYGISVLPTTGGFFLQEGGADPHSMDVIYKVTFARVKTVALDLNKLSNTGKIPPHEYYLGDYTPDPRGGLLTNLVWLDPKTRYPHYSLMKVDEHGDPQSFFSLNEDFIPSRVVSFYSGNYLLTGHSAGEPPSVLSMEILDSRGQVIVPNLKLPDGGPKVQSLKALPTADGGSLTHDLNTSDAKVPVEDLPFKGQELPASGAFSFVVTSGDDNFVYAYSVQNPKAIHKISDGGKIEEIQLVKLPLQAEESAYPIEMCTAHGQVLLHWAIFPSSRPKDFPRESPWFIPLRHYWSVYSNFDGSIITTYVSEPGKRLAQPLPGSILVGYEPRNFYFLDQIRTPSGDWSFSLLHATPK